MGDEWEDGWYIGGSSWMLGLSVDFPLLQLLIVRSRTPQPSDPLRPT